MVGLALSFFSVAAAIVVVTHLPPQSDWDFIALPSALLVLGLSLLGGFGCVVGCLFDRKRRRRVGVVGGLLHLAAAVMATTSLMSFIAGAPVPHVAARGPAGPPPVQALGAVADPIFRVGEEQLSAGHVFAASVPEGPDLVLTALHLFGPAGGLPEDVPPETLPELVRSAQFRSLLDAQSTTTTLRALRIPEAAPMGEAGKAGDVAAFVASELKLSPLTMAKRTPTAGEHLWLISELPGSMTAIHHAVSAGVQDGMLYYYFDGPLELRGSSGAPVVDSAGQLVAINVGGSEDESGAAVGIGNPTQVFLPYLLSR